MNRNLAVSFYGKKYHLAVPALAALFLCLAALSPARADHRWLFAHYGEEHPEPPAAAISFLDARIPPGGSGEVWLRVPDLPGTRVLVCDPAGNPVRESGLDPGPGEGRHRLDVGGLEPGEYLLVLEHPRLGRLAASPFRVAGTSPPERASVALLVDEPAGRDWSGFPVTLGVPFPRGVLAGAGQARVLDASGTEVPAQVRVTGTWNPEGGNARWLEVSFLADGRRDAGAEYRLEYGTAVRRAEPEAGVSVRQTLERLFIDAGRLTFSVNREKGTIFEEMTLDGKPVAARAGLELQDDNRRLFTSALDPEPPEITVEEAGPVRAVIRQRGWYADASGERLCRYDVRLEVFAGRPYARLLHTWILTHDSREARFGDISLRVETAGRMETGSFLLEPGEGETVFAAGLAGRERVSLVQSDSDRFDLLEWPSGSNSVRTLREGSRSGGSVSVTGSGIGVTAHLREMWQQYPAELEAAAWGLAVHFWPAHGFDYRHREREVPIHRWPLSDGPFMDLQPREYVEGTLMLNTERVLGYDRINALGLAKTHEVWLDFQAGDGVVSAPGRARAMFEESPVARADPEWVSATGIFRPFLSVDPGAFPVEEAAISARWEAVESLQDAAHNYGWLHYGDHQTYAPLIDGDGRHYFHGGAAGSAHRHWRGGSYRAGVEPWLLWMRSGERRYYRVAEAMSRHIMDIDYVHWASDEVHPPRRPGNGYLQAFSHYNSSLSAAFVHNEPVGFALMYRHLAGYRRAADFLGDVGRNMSGYAWTRPLIARGQMSMARQLFDLYRETWDRNYYERAWALVTRMLDDLVTRRLNPSHMSYMYELLHDWREMTADSRVEPALRSLAGMYIGKPTGVDAAYPVLYDFGHLYELTGDPEYIAWGKGILQTRLHGVATESDPPWRGRVTRADPITLTRLIRQVPGFLYQLRQAEAEHGFIEPRYQPVKFRNSAPPAVLFNENGGDFRLRLFMRFIFWPRSWPEGGRATGRARVTGPGGELAGEVAIDSAALEFPAGMLFRDQDFHFDLAVAGQGPGLYTLEFIFDDGFVPGQTRGVTFNWGLGNPDRVRVAYGTRRADFDGGQVFFRVPPGTDSFSLLIPELRGYLGEPVLVDASGREIARAAPPFGEGEPRRWTVDLPSGPRGEIFGLVSSAPMSFELGPELPPFLYSEPAEFFALP